MVLLLIFVSSCKKLELPVTHSITDPKDNSLIPVKITGLSKTHVDFIRLKDSKFFSYPISKLTPEDQKFVRRYTLMETDPELMKPSVKEQIVIEPRYIQSRLDYISKLEKAITRLELEMQTENTESALFKRHAEIIAGNKKEISELESDINIYRLDH